MDFGAWNQLPADIGTSSSLLRFKDSTKHYTGPGRQLPSVTTVAAWCSQVAYLGLLNYICLWKLCSISLTQISTFLSRKQKRRLIFVFNQVRWKTSAGGADRAVCSSWDQLLLWSLSFQSENIFPSDATQDRQIMRSLVWQPQRIDCLWLRDRQRDRIPLSSVNVVFSHHCSIQRATNIVKQHSFERQKKLAENNNSGRTEFRLHFSSGLIFFPVFISLLDLVVFVYRV